MKNFKQEQRQYDFDGTPLASGKSYREYLEDTYKKNRITSMLRESRLA